MHIIEDVRTTTMQFNRVAVTIGCFDGVHLGHRQIIQALLEEARAIGGTPAVMVLEPNPRLFFAPQHAPNMLTAPEQKCRLLQELGVEVLYMLPFDEATAATSAHDFVETILVERCRAQAVVVGHDFAFGYRARGDYAFLEGVAPEYGFHTRQVPPLIIGGQRVSSTLIRERVVQGEVEDIEVYLGRKYTLTGTVASGSGIGRILGFPTANLDIGLCAVPAHGVYAAEAVVDGKRYNAAVNIGIAPTIRGSIQIVEAHLLDFSSDLTGSPLALVFHKHLRPEKKFSSRDDLIAAIARDVQSVRAFFAGQG